MLSYIPHLLQEVFPTRLLQPKVKGETPQREHHELRAGRPISIHLLRKFPDNPSYSETHDIPSTSFRSQALETGDIGTDCPKSMWQSWIDVQSGFDIDIRE